MNIAAKAIADSYAMHGQLSKLFRGYYPIRKILLISLVVVSAFAVILERSLYRVTLSEFQMLQLQQQELSLQQKQLQLEASVWATQSRVQVLAETKLGMRLPDSEHTILVKL